MKKRKEARYKPELPRLLYTFFTNYADIGAPSFEKFARGIGMTLEDIERFRSHTEFERAYRECNEIRRDYLIDNALCKRMDSSFAKFILGCEYGMGEKDIKDEDRLLEVKLEVIE
jgi:hypothetical protein